MSRDEWESLCDGCGQCCLLKVEDEDTGKIFLTELACKLLDLRSCRCRDYGDRHASVPDCVVIDKDNVRQITLAAGELRLPPPRRGAWARMVAPLVSGDPDTVHHAGISARGWIRSEEGVRPSAIARYIIGEAG